MSNPLVFLDTETTGLDPDRHEVWEVAWAVDEGPIMSAVVPHSLRTADPKALELNGYWTRGFEQAPGVLSADVTLREILTGATIVGSNPAFDAAFLRARWGVAPWHHRLIAVESMAFAVFGYERPKGLAAVADDLRDRGYEIPQPDHTAAADVACLRAVYTAIRADAPPS
jgi:DNA polymerase III epsilon subunit-like protein